MERQLRPGSLRWTQALVISAALGCLAPPLQAAGDDWFPLPVEVHEPPFAEDGARREVAYVPLAQATRRWRVCASIPHLADTFWVAVNFGLAAEAERLGIAMQLHVAGSYLHLDRQRAQLESCLADRVDAIIIGAISGDGLTDLVLRIRAAGIPVIDLINGMAADGLSARSAASYRDTAYLTGRYIAARSARLSRPVRIAWFPGPDGAKWAIDANRGLQEALHDVPHELVATVFGNTSQASQTEFILAVLRQHPQVDYVVGSTATAVAGARVLRDLQLRESTKTLATYYGPGVHRGIMRGTILAAPTELPTATSRIAVDQAVRILEGEQYFVHVSPKLVVVDRENIAELNVSASLAPKGFQPVYRINWSSDAR